MSERQVGDDDVLDFYAWREVVYFNAKLLGVGRYGFVVVNTYYNASRNHDVEIDRCGIDGYYHRNFITLSSDQLTTHVAQLVVMHLLLGIPCDNLKKIS